MQGLFFGRSEGQQALWHKAECSCYLECMDGQLERNFGLIIAYLLPGFVGIAGVGEMSDSVARWLSLIPNSDPTIAGFLFVGLASLALGVTLSGVRWLIVDGTHHLTGVAQPVLDYGKLQANILAYNLAVEHNYRYYQFYANMQVAIVMLTACQGLSAGTWPYTALSTTGLLALELVLFWASRDCLRRFYARVGQILAPD